MASRDSESFQHIESILENKPALRTPVDNVELCTLLREQPFFAGVDSASLQQICSFISLQRLAPGEVVYHPGEVTDRMYLLLRGRCKLVRHSCKAGHVPQQGELRPGQTFAEASLVLAGRHSDLLVAAADGEGGSGGVALAVMSKGAWGTMCAKAPMVPECGGARIAMLCCAARALCAVAPAERTPEQCEDIAALLRQMPGLSSYSAPVLRSMSEAALLRHLPPGTILHEEYTRAESQLLLLTGTVETHVRPKKYGEKRAALRTALRTAVAAKRSDPTGGRRGAGGDGAPKTVQQKINEERKAREQMREALALKREGLRSPSPERARAMQRQMTKAKDVEAGFKHWMLEYMTRKRGIANPADLSIVSDAAILAAQAQPGAAAAAAALGLGLSGGALGLFGAKPAANPAAALLVKAGAPKVRVVNAWKRAVQKALHSEASAAGGVGGEPGDPRVSNSGAAGDPMLREYERRKREEEHGVSDVGQLLGGAGARTAYQRGLQDSKRSKDQLEHAEGEQEGAAAEAGAAASEPLRGPHGHALHDGAGEEGLFEEDEEEDDDDPLVRLTYLTRSHRVVRKPMRFLEAMEKVLGVAKCQDDLERERALEGRPAGGEDDGRDGAGQGAPTGISLLFGAAAEDGGDGADGDATGGGATDRDMPVRHQPSSSLSDGPYTDRSSAPQRPGAAQREVEVEVEPDSQAGDEPTELHLEQLFGPITQRTEAGSLVGELPAPALARGAPRPRRTASAIAGPAPSGCDVLIFSLSSLRRGADAARDDLAASRLAVLGSLDPLRALSEEHQAQLALSAAVMTLDAQETVVRQGQPVEAMIVVLEGELRVVDDPENLAAPPPSIGTHGGAATASGGGGGGGGALAAEASSLQQSAGGAGGGGGGGGAGAGDGGGAGRQLQSVSSIKARRAAAALPTLLLLGPGGSFGENVLGYPDTSEGAAPGQVVDGPNLHPASVVASRACKLLVLPRALLLKFGPVRTALPPFASTRRDVLAVRRAQVKQAAPHPTASLAALGAGTGTGTATSTGGSAPRASSSGGREDGPLGQQQRATLSMALTQGLPQGAVAGGSFTGGSPGLGLLAPRPPAPRPMEMLEQLGFSPMSKLRIVGATASAGGSAAPSPSSAASTPDRRGANIVARINQLEGCSSPGTGSPSGAAAQATPKGAPAGMGHRRSEVYSTSSLSAPSNAQGAAAAGRPTSGGGDGAQAAQAVSPVGSALPPPNRVRRTSLTGNWSPLAAGTGSPTAAHCLPPPKPASYASAVGVRGSAGSFTGPNAPGASLLGQHAANAAAAAVHGAAASGASAAPGAAAAMDSPPPASERHKRSSMPGCLPRAGPGAGGESGPPSPSRRPALPSFMGAGSQLLLPRIGGPAPGTRNARASVGGGGGADSVVEGRTHSSSSMGGLLPGVHRVSNSGGGGLVLPPAVKSYSVMVHAGRAE